MIQTALIRFSVVQGVSLSLIVLQCVSAVKYLGPAPLAAHSALSPSFLPYRTALDVLQPGLSYSYPWAPFAPRYQPLSGPFTLFPHHLVSAPHNAVAPVPVPAEVTDDIVDVTAEETDDDEAVLGEITLRDHIDALPEIPSSPFRDSVPVIPAGIVQATQPKFVQTIFKVNMYLLHCHCSIYVICRIPSCLQFWLSDSSLTARTRYRSSKQTEWRSCSNVILTMALLCHCKMQISITCTISLVSFHFKMIDKF